MTDLRKKIGRELAAARSAAERKRTAGQSDAFEQAQMGRLQGEIDRLNGINEQARPAVEAMDRRERQKREAAEHAATQRRNREEREFGEALQRHYEDRLGFYRLTRPGLSKADFDKEIWPEIRAAYVAGEPDIVEQECLLGSTPVF